LEIIRPYLHSSLPENTIKSRLFFADTLYIIYTWTPHSTSLICFIGVNDTKRERVTCANFQCHIFANYWCAREAQFITMKHCSSDALWLVWNNTWTSSPVTYVFTQIQLENKCRSLQWSRSGGCLTSGSTDTLSSRHEVQWGYNDNWPTYSIRSADLFVRTSS
jgi:hypothetical protein